MTALREAFTEQPGAALAERLSPREEHHFSLALRRTATPSLMRQLHRCMSEPNPSVADLRARDLVASEIARRFRP